MWTLASHPLRECWGWKLLMLLSGAMGLHPAADICLREQGGWGELDQDQPLCSSLLLLSWHSSTTKVLKLSIRANLHVEMNPEGNLEVVTSACKPTVEEVASTEEKERLILWFSLGNFLYGIWVTGEKKKLRHEHF